MVFNTWTVITFVDEQSVSAVPSSWLHEDSMCFWPSNCTNKQAVTAIEKSESPDPKTWKLYKYTGFRNNVYETFKEDDQKARKAMVTSELDSDASSGSKQRRKNDGSSSESDVDDRVIKKKNFYPKIPLFKKSIVDEYRKQSLVSVVSPRTPNISQVDISGSIGTDKDPSVTIHKYLEFIVRKLNIMQGMMGDLNTRLEALEKQRSTSQTAREEEEKISFYTEVPYLPITCADDLASFESYLSIEDNMKNAIREISLLGGKDAYDFVSRDTNRLITNRFCGAEYSYIGKREKKAFHVLNLKKLLTKSAMRIFPDMTEKDVELAISKWIRRCTERSKKETNVI